jgi:hypothetical protein
MIFQKKILLIYKSIDIHGCIGSSFDPYCIQPSFLYFTKYKPNPTHSIFFDKII